MTKILTKDEYEAEREAHKNESEFRIIAKEPDGTINELFTFWAKDTDAANEVLKETKKNFPIPAGSESEYYWAHAGGYISLLNDGSYKIYDSMQESHEDWLEEHDTLLENISMWFHVKWMRVKDIGYFFRDLCFWIKNYDRMSCRSHDYGEYWSIYCTVLDDIKFNIPRLQENMHGCCDKYVNMARELYKNDPNYGPDTDWVELGCELWKKELDKFLDMIALYEYYEGYGIYDENDDRLARIASCYDIPILDGSLDRIDYTKLHDLTMKAWNNVWDWWRENGMALWD